MFDGMMRSLYLWFEFLVLFVMVPAAYWAGLVPVHKIVLLVGVFVFCLVYLLRSPGYDNMELVDGIRRNAAELRWVMVRSVGVAVLSVALVWALEPELLFSFPRSRPWLWLVVMVLYPLLSAYPQEVIYRAFVFRRYVGIFRTRHALIVASVLTFSFVHVVFDNWVAVLLTIPAGCIFTRTYLRSGSLLLAAVEHALYGGIVFTTGVGRYFYSP